jgi:hypothetical protein
LADVDQIKSVRAILNHCLDVEAAVPAAMIGFRRQHACRYSGCCAGDMPAATSTLQSNARSGFVKSAYSFKTDLIKVPNDF